MKKYFIISEAYHLEESDLVGDVVLLDDLKIAIQIKIDKLKDYANWSGDYDKAEFTIEQLKELL